jgi:hypothetical protein
VALTGAALAGAIDMAATARPATKSDDAFMAISFQILRTANAVPDRKILFSDFIRLNTKLRGDNAADQGWVEDAGTAIRLAGAKV